MVISYLPHPIPSNKDLYVRPKAQLLKKIPGFVGKTTRLLHIPLFPYMSYIGTYTISSKEGSTFKMRILSDVLSSNPSLPS